MATLVLNCLVTGGAGFIGSHVVDQLIEAGNRVVVLDNLSTGDVNNLNPEATFINADITDPETWRALNGFDVVFHLAALARVQPSIKDPITHNHANVDGTLQVLEYCRRDKAKLVYSGSSSVYTGEDIPTDEDGEIMPASPYALQKLIGEQYIRLYNRLYGVDYAILRYFSVYGERQPLEGAYRTVVGIFMQQFRDGEALTITSDGEQRRDFTYVKDVARANLMAINWRGTYNIGASHSLSINELADMFPCKKEYIGEVSGEVRETLAYNAKARYQGWSPTVEVSDWVKEQLND
jgi:UDP-glucose 4-epimerase